MNEQQKKMESLIAMLTEIRVDRSWWESLYTEDERHPPSPETQLVTSTHRPTPYQTLLREHHADANDLEIAITLTQTNFQDDGDDSDRPVGFASMDENGNFVPTSTMTTTTTTTSLTVFEDVDCKVRKVNKSPIRKTVKQPRQGKYARHPYGCTDKAAYKSGPGGSSRQFVKGFTTDEALEVLMRKECGNEISRETADAVCQDLRRIQMDLRRTYGSIEMVLGTLKRHRLETEVNDSDLSDDEYDYGVLEDEPIHSPSLPTCKGKVSYHHDRQTKQFAVKQFPTPSTSPTGKRVEDLSNDTGDDGDDDEDNKSVIAI